MENWFEKLFIPKVKKIPGGCWEWQAAHCGVKGKYGKYSPPGKKSGLAHRVAYENLVGPIPKGMCVCHKCDNPGCVNPDHLFLGTRADNSRDMVKKGRSNKGEKVKTSKLTESDVKKIRYDHIVKGVLQKDLAAKYGVSKANICLIVNGKYWPHVPV